MDGIQRQSAERGPLGGSWEERWPRAVAAGFEADRREELAAAFQRAAPGIRLSFEEEQPQPSTLADRTDADVLVLAHGEDGGSVDRLEALRRAGSTVPVILVGPVGKDEVDALVATAPVAVMDEGPIDAHGLHQTLIHLGTAAGLHRQLQQLRRELLLLGDDNLRLGRRLTQLSDQLACLAVEEELSAQPSETSLMARIEEAVQMARRRGGGLCCLLLQLEGLAALRQSRGSAFADFFLVQAAHRLKRRVRSTDLLARYGQDGFIVLSRHRNPQIALALARRLEAALNEEPLADGMREGVKVGIAFLSEKVKGGRELLQAAEDAVDLLRPDLRIPEPPDGPPEPAADPRAARPTLVRHRPRAGTERPEAEVSR